MVVVVVVTESCVAKTHAFHTNEEKKVGLGNRGMCVCVCLFVCFFFFSDCEEKRPTTAMLNFEKKKKKLTMYYASSESSSKDE